ncbi:MAG: hypothetical protein E6J34_11480 [Chloroflexi bacterium]|nr:MAG: hypothetical protein E6J34_11480 [Chloroflexota bacterium]
MQENTARLTTIAPKSPQDGQRSADKSSWERQKNEPALWYMCFKRYLEMGTKRSLRAVYVAEPVAQKATKKQAATQKSLSDVSVPGSWTRAAKVWNWTTRAREYDLTQMEKDATKIRAIAEKTPHASRAYRLITLDTCGQVLRNILEQIGSIPPDKMSLYLSVIARYQSVMRDIAVELQGVELTDLCDATAYDTYQVENQVRRMKKAQRTQKKKEESAYDAMRKYEEIEQMARLLQEVKG